jgi:hypothetical protein
MHFVGSFAIYTCLACTYFLHVLHKLNLAKHVYRKQFFECFREAIFKPNEEDMRFVEQKLFQNRSEEFKHTRN